MVFYIPGIPTGKGRPRFARTAKGVKTFTPQKTVVYENLVRMAYKQAGGKYMLDENIRAEITAYYDIPKSTSKKRRAAMLAGMEYPGKKPDCDNVAKIVLDALNGIAYRDDAAVVELMVKKRYGEQPGVYVTIERLKAVT